MYVRLASLEAEVEAFDGVCEGSDRYEVYTSLAVAAESVDGYATARFDFDTGCILAYDRYCIGGAGRGEVVEHYAVDTGFDSLTDFIFVAHFDLYPEVFAVLLAICLGLGYGSGDAAGEVDVVVLDQNHVEETDAVVVAAADSHGFFLEDAHAGCCLACVEHLAWQTCEKFLIFRSDCGYAAHALHDVEHESFGLQQRAYGTFDHESYVAGLDMGAVFDENSHFERRIKAFEYATGNVDTCQYTFFLDQKMLASHCVGADSTESGVVAVAYILGER